MRTVDLSILKLTYSINFGIYKLLNKTCTMFTGDIFSKIKCKVNTFVRPAQKWCKGSPKRELGPTQKGVKAAPNGS